MLDAAGWPASLRALEAGRTVIPWWWEDDADALSALVRIAASEGPGARIDVDADGVFVFESRHHRLLAARSTLSQGEFAGAGAAALLASPFGYDPGLRDVINECAIVVEDREEPAVAEAVWTLPGEVMLSPGESRVYVVTAPDPFLDAVTPVAGTDFVIVAGALAMMALDRTSGQSVALTLTAGGSGARLMGLQVRARPVRVVGRTRVVTTIDASASIARYGRRSCPLEAPWTGGVNEAQDFCNAIAAAYWEPRTRIAVRLAASGEMERRHQIEREVSDRITVSEAETGLRGGLSRGAHRAPHLGRGLGDGAFLRAGRRRLGDIHPGQRVERGVGRERVGLLKLG